MIELNNVSYSYPAPSGRTAALNGITAAIRPGITAVIGCTGSGKSTLTEIIAGITAPDSGTVTLDGKPVRECRKKIGSVFQYPEYQLFAETVYDDIAYGPKNLGITGDALDKCVKDAAYRAGLTDKQLTLQPFELSGGQKRLAALAGILAMSPEVLVLDEPAAGLDPSGRTHLFEILRELRTASPEMTILFVTHSMEDAAQYADDIIVLRQGTIAAHDTPENIFSDAALLSECSLAFPEMAALSRLLADGGMNIGTPLTVEDAFMRISEFLKGGGSNAS